MDRRPPEGAYHPRRGRAVDPRPSGGKNPQNLERVRHPGDDAGPGHRIAWVETYGRTALQRMNERETGDTVFGTPARHACDLRVSLPGQRKPRGRLLLR